MNILPKKSWHVRTKKNIERVKRDEAEADRLDRLNQDKSLRAEQEHRMRELRARAGLPEQVSGKPKHFNLFEGHEEQQQTSNPEHEEEERQRVAARQQKAGIWNKLVRSNDVNRPWYCIDSSSGQSTHTSQVSDSRKSANSELITSIYDPMVAIKHAEEIVRGRRSRNKSSLLQHDNNPTGHDQDGRLAINETTPGQAINIIDRGDSSPEIIGEVVGRKVMKHKKEKKSKKTKKTKDEKEHHKRHKEKKHNKHRHHMDE